MPYRLESPVKPFPLIEPDTGTRSELQLGLDKDSEGVVFHLLAPGGSVILSSPRIPMEECEGLVHRHEYIGRTGFKIWYEMDGDVPTITFLKWREWLTFGFMSSEPMDFLTGAEANT